MTKFIKRGIVVALLLAILLGLSYLWQAFPIISGYGAKNLCTCVFVAGRTVESVLEDELGAMPLSLGSFEVSWQDSSATGAVFGLATKKAIFRKGLGCTLISEISEQDIRSQNIRLIDIPAPSDTFPWPMGTVIPPAIVEGVDYQKLNKAVKDAFVEDNSDSKANTRGVVVVYKDQIIAEKYAENFDVNTPQVGWSMTKSVTATVVGMMIKDGLLSLEDSGFFTEWENDERNKITLDQLLRMSSGLQWDENYAGPSTATNMLFKSADMGNFALNQPLAFAPDEYWYYSSGTSNIISKITREKLKEDYHNYIRMRLFVPLNMSSAVIEPDASGTYVGSSYMYATPRDWAKFGLLYLNNGQWNGEQLIPENWAKYVSTPTPKAPIGEYGAHFWLNAGEQGNETNRIFPDAPVDLYCANGYEGQRVFIIPSKQLVIVRMGQTKDRDAFDFNAFLKSILEAFNNS